MNTITITMQHTADTVKQLAKAQYNTFNAKRKAFWYVAFFSCLLGGVGTFGEVSSQVQLFLLAIGGIGIMNVGVSAQVRADRTLKLIEQRNVGFPHCEITLTKQKISIVEEGRDKPLILKPDMVHRLAEDGQYYYIFVNRDAAYMLPKDQIEDKEGFVELLESATKGALLPPFSLQNVNIGWLKERFAKKK